MRIIKSGITGVLQVWSRRSWLWWWYPRATAGFYQNLQSPTFHSQTWDLQRSQDEQSDEDHDVKEEQLQLFTKICTAHLFIVSTKDQIRSSSRDPDPVARFLHFLLTLRTIYISNLIWRELRNIPGVNISWYSNSNIGV